MTDNKIEKIDIEDTACVVILHSFDDGKYVALEDYREAVSRLQKIIKKLKADNKQLKQNYDEVYDFKCKLENELIERGFAEYAHGDFHILSDEEKQQIRNETAEKIYNFVKSHTALSGDIEELLQYISEAIICRVNS